MLACVLRFYSKLRRLLETWYRSKTLYLFLVAVRSHADTLRGAPPRISFPTAVGRKS